MKQESFQNFLGKKVLFFDGGTGSVLQEKGLKPGELPETWNILHAEKIVQLHFDYFCAGCNIIKTNTFGANSLKFPLKENIENISEESFCLEDIIESALKNAYESREKIESTNFSDEEIFQLREKNLVPKNINPKNQSHFIAFDVGPLGKLLEPLGDLSFERAIQIFSQTIKIGLISEKKPDLILIETMNDCYEAKAAILAAKETMEDLKFSLPIVVTTVYDESGKSLTGSNPETMTTILESLDVNAFGLNCSLGPNQMKPIFQDLVENASIPLVANPNAGLPRSENGCTVYDVSAEEFAKVTSSFVDMGAAIVGGCCGTTPEHICRLVDLCYEKSCVPVEDKGKTKIASYTQTVSFGNRPILVGERINPTGKKRFKQALRENDFPYILQEGLSQEEKGVHVLDVNVGLPEIDEVLMLKSVVKELQSVTELPLQIDTSNSNAMEAALRIYNGKPLVNSVNGKEEVMKEVFPLVKKYGGVVVALTLDESGIPETTDGRVKIVEKIYSTAASYGISKKDIIIDPLTMAISSDSKAAIATLETLRIVHEKFGGTTILGVSNISFGLPQRDLITSSFFTVAMQNGLSAAIMNPNSLEMMKAYNCFCTLSGYDENCTEYISFAEKYQESLNSVQNISSTENAIKKHSEDYSVSQDSLEYAVIRGLKTEAATRTNLLLKTEDPIFIINNRLIPALDIVGKGFEAKRIYLPQLLMSAEATKTAFSVIKEKLIESGNVGESKGKILLATVKGDIHDIGKNIVKVLLENYSFTVIDLGKDVAPEKIVEVAKEQNIIFVGLSALMTTTVPAMEETIKLLRKEKPECKVCVGGAVLTPEYANMIGADFYAKDALETVKYAQKIFC